MNNDVLQTEGAPQTIPPEFHSIVYHSVLAGLTPFIPVPFLDDWVRERITRSMVKHLLVTYRQHPNSEQIAIFCEGQSRSRGCFRSIFLLPVFLFKKLIIYLISKVIKKIFIILTFNECSEFASETFHIGFFVWNGLETGVITPDLLESNDEIDRIHTAIVATCAEIDTRIFRRLFREAVRNHRSILRRTGAMLGRAGRSLKKRLRRDKTLDLAENPFEEERDSELGSMVDVLSISIWKMTDYLENAARTFHRHLQTSEGEDDASTTNSSADTPSDSCPSSA